MDFVENGDFFSLEKTCELVLFLQYGYLLMTRKTNKTSTQVFSDPKISPFSMKSILKNFDP